MYIINCVEAMNSISNISKNLCHTGAKSLLRSCCVLKYCKRQGTRSRVLQRRNNAAASSSYFHFSAFTQQKYSIALSARPKKNT